VKPFLLLRAAELRAEQPDGLDDVHFTEALAASVIEDATRPGDTVLDPFAGYGTTLAVAARLGRQAVGVELLADHLAVARKRVPPGVRLVHGDSRRLRELVEEPIDLVLTSPPYMTSVEHPENPLTGYATDDGDYKRYLDEVADVFEQAGQLLKPGGQVVLNVANLAVGDHVTPLAWDVARAVSRQLRFRGETFLCWDEHPPGFAGDYLLWFERP
jgi:DNA modification methylase